MGGSGLYINSLVYPLDFTDATEDEELRERLYREVEKKGNNYLHQKLVEIDPATGEKVHPNDVKRVVRAIEIYHLTGKPMSQYKQDLQNTDIPYDLAMIGLTMNRSSYMKVNRVDHIRSGFCRRSTYLVKKVIIENLYPCKVWDIKR